MRRRSRGEPAPLIEGASFQRGPTPCEGASGHGPLFFRDAARNLESNPVHIEVESRSREGFGERMHEYYMALRLRHRCPVFPIALVRGRGKEEVRQMRKMWSEVLMERGEARGEARGRKLGEQLGELRAKRETLLALMRAKYGPLPARVTKAVAAIANRRRLDTLLRRVLTARTLDEMGL